VEDVRSCTPLPTDYRPRENHSSADTWPACISDDNTYHPLGTTISTVARVDAWEQVADLLWEDGRVPTADDFLAARVLYAQDQGLDSRVQRRQDIHYPPLPDGQRCSDPGVPEANPDRCVGPAKLLPILNDAFQKGTTGQDTVVQAARVEAALLWFLYASSLSEAWSCASAPQDCDSAWAYYSGGAPRETPRGLSGGVAEQGAETHNRAYDALLAVRCWRNLDNEAGAAQDTSRQGLAMGQLDRALVRGVALVLRHRFSVLACSTGEAREAALAFIKTLGPFLDRAARAVDASLADRLAAQVAAATASQVEPAVAQQALDALFPCP
jgi:hypothetical protein